MASKRMFSIEVLLGEDFYGLSFGAQALYYRLCQMADDDGILSGAREQVRAMRCTQRHVKELLDSGMLLAVEDKLVITHWKQHNSIKPSRHKPTRYPHILAQLYVNGTGAYALRTGQELSNTCPTNVEQISAEDSIEKESKEEHSKDEDRQEVAAPSEGLSEGLSVTEFGQKVLELYGINCQNLLPCSYLSEELGKRISQLQAGGVDLAMFEQAFRMANNTPFLTGQGEKGWKAGLDWLCQGDKLRQVLAGKYEAWKKSPAKNPTYGCNDLGSAELEAIQALLSGAYD